MINIESQLSKNAKRRVKRKENLNQEITNLLNAVKQAKGKKALIKLKN